MKKYLFGILFIIIVLAVTSIAQGRRADFSISVPTTPETPNLIGHWALDGNAIDSSGYGNHGSVFGAIPTTDRFGVTNGAYSFDGSSQYISIADDISLRPANEMTISVWVKPNQILAEDRYIISKRDSYFLDGMRNFDKRPHFYVFNSAGNYGSIAGTELKAGEWNHIAGTYKGSTISMYVNGIQAGSSTFTGGIGASTSPVYIGTDRYRTPSTSWKGGIDDVRIYDRALSAAEIQQLNNTGTPPVEADYYVNGSVTRSGDGSSLENAFKTIQEAANIVTAGDTVLVYPGTYKERISFPSSKQSGTVNNKITFKAHGTVVMEGFDTRYADYLRIEGFNITLTGDRLNLPDWSRHGIFYRSNGVEIVDNYFFDIPGPAIAGRDVQPTIEPYKTGGYIAYNKIYRCQAGIWVFGDDFIVEKNVVERLYDWPNKAGDCDYSRLFGRNIIVRNNHFHGSTVSEIGASHVDGFQFFNVGGSRYLHDVVIENNIVEDFHQGLMIEDASQQHMSNITLKNNVFKGGEIGNQITDSGQQGQGVVDKHGGIEGLNIIHNVFSDLGATGIMYRSSGIIANNIFHNIRTDFSPGAASIQTNNIVSSQNPRFVDHTSAAGPDGKPFTDDDGFRLQSGSPAINFGIDVGVRTDILGNTRTGPPDAGAYEYVSP